MRKLFSALAVGTALALSLGSVAHAAPPTEFGSDWDDPRTAAPPIDRPDAPSCTVQIVNHQFVDFTPYTNSYTPPADCAGPWSKVVLHLDGKVAGRQFDRLGALSLGDVTIFKTSTPEPSADGIAWSVEKDVTSYSGLLAKPQPVWMLIGNVVDGTYTGVLDIQVSLTFYRGPFVSRPAEDVLPLAGVHREGTAQVGTVTLSKNTERLTAEVYATGSGGGCEEFWYLTSPSSTGYSCPVDAGPYREVQVLVDGQLAGIAAPFPHVYTGGWSNPFLWYVLPAPRAFDVKPISYDLTPFVGRLTDGAAHTIAVRVVGVPADQSGWDVPTNLLAWRDSAPVTGRLASATTFDQRNDVTTGDKKVAVKAGHRFVATGTVATSHGPVTTTVEQILTDDSTHWWSLDENHDELAATWTDSATVTRTGSQASVVRDNQRYVLNGYIDVDAANRLTTKLTMTDAGVRMTMAGPGPVGWQRLDDTFTGQASWTLGVPRPDRHPTGTSQETYKLNSYARTLRTVNGFLV